MDICRQRDSAASTAATLLKDRETLKLHGESQLAPSRKHLRLGNYQIVDAAALTWFKNARHHGVPLSGPIIQEKARQFAVTLGTSSFDVSAAWLYQFWQRNDIVWQVTCGEERQHMLEAHLPGGTSAFRRSSSHSVQTRFSTATEQHVFIICRLTKE